MISSIFFLKLTVLNVLLNNRFMIAIPVMLMLVLFSWGVEANAQCAPGFSPRTIKMTVNGCDYDVFFCVDCQSVSAPGEIYLTGFIQDTSNCTQTLTSQQVFTALLNQVNVTNLLTHLCSETMGFIDPCPNHNVNSTFLNSTPVCWKMERVMYLSSYERVLYSPCSGAYCREDYYICFVPFPPPGHYEKHTIAGPYLVGTPSCTLESWEVEEPTGLNEPTECFIFETPCDE